MARGSLGFLPWALALFLVGCGTPKIGENCPTQGEFWCASPASANECFSGKVRALPCQGDGGCQTTNSQIICNLAPAEGEACPAVFEGGGRCGEVGTNRLFACESGLWKGTVCPGCYAKDTKIYCKPIAGDTCTTAQQWARTCDLITPNQGLYCIDGSWQAAPCKSCSMSTGDVACAP